MSDTEKKIVRKLVQDAVDKGYKVSVFDGEAYPLKRSQNVVEIMCAVMSTDEDVLVIRDSNDVKLGQINLIYGNGCDVISDHSDNKAMADLLAGASALAEQLA